MALQTILTNPCPASIPWTNDDPESALRLVQIQLILEGDQRTSVIGIDAGEFEVAHVTDLLGDQVAAFGSVITFWDSNMGNFGLVIFVDMNFIFLPKIYYSEISISLSSWSLSKGL